MTDADGNYLVGVQVSPYTPGASIFSGAVAAAQQVFLDNQTPTDTSKPALSFPAGGGTLSQWDPGSQAYV